MVLSKLHPRLQDFVKDAKWGDLTPIQKKAFEPIYGGENCLVEAPTAGGKTEAVLFPLLTRIARGKSSGFKVLYIAPLKALLNDLALRVVPYAEMCYLEAFKWHGDVGQAEKIQQMSFPSDILLTTPESLEAILLRRANLVELFANLETVVIDEAHYFALTERGSHLVSLLRRIDHAIKKHPQRIAISATIGNPEELLSWLIGAGQSGQIVRVESDAVKERDFTILYFRNDEGIRLQNCLYQLLTQKNKSIVFERSRSATEATATRINERNLALHNQVPVKVRTHHSSVSKRLREDAEGSIRQQAESSLNAIISTSTLELGIDIGQLEQVVQIGGLNSPGSFLQRVGRTGRKPGNPQFFRGLCNDPEELILLASCVSLGWERISESILFPRKAFHILAHQIICLCLQERGISTGKAWDLLSEVTCFAGISSDEYRDLIGSMLEGDFLRRLEGDVLLPGDETERVFLQGNWRRLFAIFDTGPSYTVVDGKKIIGTLDSGFARSQELPFVFVLGGQEWNTIRLDHEMQQVSVRKNNTGVAPKWNVIGSFDIPFELAQEVGRILMNDIALSFLDSEANLELTTMRNTYQQLGWQKDRWILESSMIDSGVNVWTFAGEKINRGMTILLEGRMSVQAVYDYKKISIEGKKGRSISLAELQAVMAFLASCSPEALEDEIEEKVRNRWFSKFSSCLPDHLSRKAICERDYDIPGLVRELRAVACNCVSD